MLYKCNIQIVQVFRYIIIIKQHTQSSVFTQTNSQQPSTLLQLQEISNQMSWLLFKDSESYQPRGKKCDGFPNFANKPHINLSWGMDNNMDTLQAIKQENQTNRNKNVSKNQRNYYTTGPHQQRKSVKDKKQNLPSGVYEKKSQQEELQKIMNSYKNKQIGYQSPMKVMDLQKKQNKIGRSQTQQSAQKLKQIESSLLQSPPQPYHRRDTMGSIINQDKLSHPQLDLSESRLSRRSSSGNKKNQSKVVLGDGVYNEFSLKKEKKKDYHEMLMEMYQYEEKRNNRKVSQIAL